MGRKTQSSFEYLIIFGIAFSILILVFSLFYRSLEGGKSSVSMEQVKKIGNTIISSVEKVYYLGEGSRITIKVSFPDNINDMYIYHKNNSGTIMDILVINSSTDSGNVIEYFYPNTEEIRFNFSSGISFTTGNYTYLNEKSFFSGGIKNVRFTSMGDYVSICIFSYGAEDQC